MELKFMLMKKVGLMRKKYFGGLKMCDAIGSIKNRLDKKQTNIAVIPEGITSSFQPLD
ncbi:12441_t:CDS:2, partial [Funneliformis geosporum]